MVVFQGSYTYFTQSMTQYDSPFDKVTNQVELDDLLIRNYIAIKNSYVTDAAFKGVQAIVGVCLEDWPMAIGSVFSVVTDIWKYIGMGNMQGTPSTPQTASILERLDAIEQFLSSQGYIPPSPSNSSP